MYSAGRNLVTAARMGRCEKKWCYRDDDDQPPSSRKRFIDCICPKCTMVHQIYMLWTGRGVPRKYCGSCKPLVSGYDSSAHYESAVLVPGHSKRKGRRYEGE